ncbi:MAG: winged helix-turn-helix transcriptional regulator [Verrucomicrobia bacterium]|nr:winged helix-turn-helix transcriptional regulator [Verrucomicrobiota bacterium]
MPTRPALLDDLPFHFSRLFHVYRASLQRRLGGSKMGKHIRPGMGSIYFALCAEDDCNVKHLAERLAMPGPTLTYLLDQLEKSGVVERHDCPDDGRAYRVRLTRLGRSLEPEMWRRHDDAVAMMQSGLSKAEAATLKRLLGRVVANFQEDNARIEGRVRVSAERQPRSRNGGRGRTRSTVDGPFVSRRGIPSSTAIAEASVIRTDRPKPRR